VDTLESEKARITKSYMDRKMQDEILKLKVKLACLHGVCEDITAVNVRFFKESRRQA